MLLGEKVLRYGPDGGEHVQSPIRGVQLCKQKIYVSKTINTLEHEGWCIGRHRSEWEKTDGFFSCICLQNCLQRFKGFAYSTSCLLREDTLAYQK